METPYETRSSGNVQRHDERIPLEEAVYRAIRQASVGPAPFVDPGIILDPREHVVEVRRDNMDHLLEFSKTNAYLRYFKETILRKMMPNGMDMTFTTNGREFAPLKWMLQTVINTVWSDIIPQIMHHGTTVGAALVTYYETDEFPGQVIPRAIDPSQFSYGFTVGPNGEFRYCVRAVRQFLESRTAALQNSPNEAERKNANQIAAAWFRPTTIACPVLQASMIAVRQLARGFKVPNEDIALLNRFPKYYLKRDANARNGDYKQSGSSGGSGGGGSGNDRSGRGTSEAMFSSYGDMSKQSSSAAGSRTSNGASQNSSEGKTQGRPALGGAAQSDIAIAVGAEHSAIKIEPISTTSAAAIGSNVASTIIPGQTVMRSSLDSAGTLLDDADNVAAKLTDDACVDVVEDAQDPQENIPYVDHLDMDGSSTQFRAAGVDSTGDDGKSTKPPLLQSDLTTESDRMVSTQYSITVDTARAVWPLRWVNAYDLLIFNEPTFTNDSQAALCGSTVASIMPMLLRIDELTKMFLQITADRVNHTMVFEKRPARCDQTPAAHMIGPYEAGGNPTRFNTNSISTCGSGPACVPDVNQYIQSFTASTPSGTYVIPGATVSSGAGGSTGPAATACTGQSEIVVGTTPVQQVPPEAMESAQRYQEWVNQSIFHANVAQSSNRQSLVATRYWDPQRGIIMFESPMCAAQRLGLNLPEGVVLSSVVPPDAPANIIEQLRLLIATVIATLGIPSGPVLGDKNARIANEQLNEELFKNTVRLYQRRIVDALQRIYWRTDGHEHLANEWNTMVSTMGPNAHIIDIALRTAESMGNLTVAVSFTPCELKLEDALQLEMNHITSHALTISTAERQFGLSQEDVLYEVPISVVPMPPGMPPSATMGSTGDVKSGSKTGESNAANATSQRIDSKLTGFAAGASSSSAVATPAASKSASNPNFMGQTAINDYLTPGVAPANTAMAYYDPQTCTVSMSPYACWKLNVPPPQIANSRFSNGSSMSYVTMPMNSGSSTEPSPKRQKILSSFENSEQNEEAEKEK